MQMQPVGGQNVARSGYHMLNGIGISRLRLLIGEARHTKHVVLERKLGEKSAYSSRPADWGKLWRDNRVLRMRQLCASGREHLAFDCGGVEGADEIADCLTPFRRKRPSLDFRVADDQLSLL